MAQAGFTPISLYFSTTAAATPTAGNLANGELAINITDGKLYYKDNGGVVRLLASNATSAPVTSITFGTTGLTPSTATSGAITVAGTLNIANGGTGQTTAVAAFNALNPMTTTGDMIYESSPTTAARLPIGTTGQLLSVVGGIPAWVTPTPAGAPIGALQYMAGLTSTTYPGSDWLKCDGSIVSQSTYSTLYARIGKIPDVITTWVSRSTTGTAGNAASQIAYANNLFITTENFGFRTSTNAITWTQITAPGVTQTSLVKTLVYGSSKYVGGFLYAVGKQARYQPATSTDLVTWTTRSLPGGFYFTNVTRQRFVNNTFFLLGTEGLTAGASPIIFSSTDGITWTTRTVTGMPAGTLAYDMVYANSKYTLATNTSPALYSSTDLVTWTANSVPNNSVVSLAYGNGTYAAISSNNGFAVMTSTDAITWSARTIVGTSLVNLFDTSVTYNENNTFIVTSPNYGSSYRLVVSYDGINWLATTAVGNAAAGISNIAYGNNTFVLAASNSNNVSVCSQFSYNAATNFAVPKAFGPNGPTFYSTANSALQLNQSGAAQTLYIKAL
jgi:hypothetical protein